MKKMKYPLVALIFICVVLAGIGLKYVYDRTFVTSPIEREGEAIPGVISVELKDGTDSRTDVSVLLAGDAIIEDVYPRLQEVADSILKSSSGRLVITDRRNERLSEAYYRIHYALYEGAGTGRFTHMIEVVEGELQRFDLYAKRITVTDEHVFVTLREDKENEAYLHAVISRT